MTEAQAAEIVNGIKEGHPGAFQTLYRMQGGAIFTYLTRITGRRETAEELTQETFLTVIRKIDFFQTGRDGGLRAWIFRIASHLAIDLLRREKRQILSDDGETGEQESLEARADELLEKFELKQELQSALAALTPGQRMVLLLKEQEDMSLLEISRVCGMSENAVKQSLFRARASLKKKWEELCLLKS